MVDEEVEEVTEEVEEEIVETAVEEVTEEAEEKIVETEVEERNADANDWDRLRLQTMLTVSNEAPKKYPMPAEFFSAECCSIQKNLAVHTFFVQGCHSFCL